MRSGFGIDPREAMQMIGPIGRLGTAMKVDIADGAAAASANLQNLKVGLGDTGKALDIMAAGGNVGAFEVRDMARYFPSLTAQAQALGQSGLGAVADLTAALEIARRGAGTSEEAATNITNLLAKINSPTVTRAFAKNFGVDLPAALKAAYAQGKTPMEALAAITQKATGGDLSKLGLVVEDMQAQSALRTLILNMDDYRKIRADLGKSGGTVQAAFAQREALDASVAWQSFTGTMSALAITLGATLLPSVTQFFGWVNTGVSAIARWAQANPELAGQIMTLASAFIAGRMALGALQFGFGSMLSGLATLRNGFMMARTAAAFLIPVLGSIGLVPLLIVGGLIAAGAAIYLFRDRLMAGWTAIKAAWDGAPAWMRAIGGMMMDGLLNALIPGRLASRLLEIAQAGMTAFRNYFGIKSPSRLMMEMGGHITTGLGQGITGGTAQPLRAMGQMARRVAGAGALSLAGPSLAPSAMPGFARTGPQGASARAAPAGPITIHIHQQPGEDAEALARRVMQLIDREKRASGRFADDFDT
jgi:TP901 family phage tail tape measure protein